MDISDENILLKKGLAFQHNEQVEGARIEGEFLFTLTHSYFYIWDCNKHSLLCMLQLAQGSFSTDLWSEKVHKEVLEALFSMLSTHGISSVHVFGHKQYVQLTSSLKVVRYSQKEFLPYTYTPAFPIGIEHSKHLVLYADKKKTLGEIPSQYGVCTKIKEIDSVCYASFESGHILKLSYTDSTILSLEEVFFKYAAPVLDFVASPLVLAYFDRPVFVDLHLNVLPESIQRTQITQIIRKDPLFILSSRTNTYVLNGEFALLLKHKENGSFLSLGEKLFVSRESGAFFELFITHSSIRRPSIQIA
ncbi:hypothetical protein NECID01_1815 [Nematocida sp. AWRm77]|nr:hypothetical protein NECID01_1815 [Nematocida sp. AWRm77]